ncbi:putative alpha-amylase domain containing protein [Lyophyllum shimeji]|uniref:Alpha-amylase domain containing protein n=1 Tax=Lyophyllum shimeji TaxID=47721 RepID=A0A9P3PJ00_LYOSH|nr:putative alpha-amylase domain containing protein [Lyophyllum shimeji]
MVNGFAISSSLGPGLVAFLPETSHHTLIPIAIWRPISYPIRIDPACILATANPPSGPPPQSCHLDPSPRTLLTDAMPTSPPPPAPDRKWWKSAVVYQIYPISFLDSNGDGLGDLRGILAKLDYLRDLGVDVLWLSPIYKSPLADMGYDISDYCDIDPRYGTLEDWDELCRGVHARGMKLMMDLVVNHTSDEHEWFLASKSSKSNPKRDWYIWRPPKFDAAGQRQPPNNWRSVFQGSAWEYDESTEEYYLHLYVAKQPDLNWDNPAVREAVWGLMRFWIERGCDGFRMDVINLISKADGLPDAPISDPEQEYQLASTLFANGPRAHEYIKEMHEKVLYKHDLITVGETPFTHDASQLAAYVLPANNELNMVFQFELMDLDAPLGVEHRPLEHREWSLKEFRAVVGRWQGFKREEGFWNATFIENHDHARAVSRFGNDSDEWRAVSAKMLAVLEVSLGGTQYVYQGQELGLRNFPRSWGVEEYKDVASQNYWNRVLEKRREEMRSRGEGEQDIDMSDVLDGFQRKARDHARVPMQWDATANAGFTDGTPWMRVNDDYETWNAAAQVDDENSVLGFWKRALRVRKTHEVLIYGDFADISSDHEQVFAYTRTLGNTTALVLLNFKETEVSFVLPSERGWSAFKLILQNYDGGLEDGRGIADRVLLRGFEGRIYVQS